MEFLRAVEADAGQEMMFGQECAPVLVQQDAVGLQGIGDELTVCAVLFLKIDDLFIKIQSHQGRLPALPGKTAIRQTQPEIAFDQMLQDLSAHAVRFGAEQLGLA